MARIRNGTWIVVTDSEKALFLRNLTDHEDPHLEVTGKDEQENPSDIEQSANRPGRMQDTGWHELAKERFAADLAEKLYHEAHEGNFERLILVASPQVLGDLRAELHQEVSDRVVAEIPKTLTNHPVGKIEDLVKKELDAG